MIRFITITILLASTININAQKNLIELKHEKIAIPNQDFFVKEEGHSLQAFHHGDKLFLEDF